jgi:Regulator of chromosome condensation (RCC1) repeat
VVAAEAEADGEDALDALRPQVLDGGPDVGLDRVLRRLGHVVRVREVVVALADARGAAEVVERHRRDPTLAEAERELLVEAVEPTNVGQDYDAGAARLVGKRGESGEAVPVGGLEHEVLVRHRRAGDRPHGRERVELEAHRAHFERSLSAAREAAGRWNFRGEGVTMKLSTFVRAAALAALGLGLLCPPAMARAATAGTVVAWGCGDFTNAGQCDVPAGLSDVVAISAGAYNSLALKADGTVVAWGCGFGLCDVPAGLSNVVAISAGRFHNLALKADGTVVAWGCGTPGGGADFGQCNVPAGLSDVVAISAGTFHSLALKRDGTVVAWGCNIYYADYGECDTSNLSGAIAIAAGTYHSAALRADGTVATTTCETGQGQCDVPAGLSGVTAIAAGAFSTVALKANGTVVAWGCALDGVDYGQCAVPRGLSGVTAIAAGYGHTLAVTRHGRVVAWGCAGVYPLDYGQCDVPPGLSGVIAVSAGQTHSLALVGPPPPEDDQG